MKKKFKKIMIFLFIIIFLCLSNIYVESTNDPTPISKTNAEKAIVELADAYYNRGKNVQYCSFRKSFTYSPEEATSQHTNYVVCSDYIYSIYYQAFGIRLPHLTNTMIAYAREYYNSEEIEKNDIIEYWEKNKDGIYVDNSEIEKKYETTNSENNSINLANPTKREEYALNLLTNLKIGDIICWHDSDSGHTVLVYDIIYNEENEPIDAVIREASSNYEKKTTKITKGLSYEASYNQNNGITEGAIQERYLIEAIYEDEEKTQIQTYPVMTSFRNATYFTVLRPLQNEGTSNNDYNGQYYYATFEKVDPNEVKEDDSDEDFEKVIGYECTGRTLNNYYMTNSTKQRMNYSDIYIEKTVDVFNNSIVNLGDVLEYTITVKNNSEAVYQSFDIVENINKDIIEVVDYGGGTENNGTIVWNINSLNPGESIDKTYKVKIKKDISLLGKEIISTGTVAGIPSSTIKNFISSNLKEEYKTTLSNQFKENYEEYSGNKLINIYNDSFSVDLGITDDFNITELIKTRNSTQYYPEGATIKPSIYLNTENTICNMIMGNYFGALYTDDDEKVSLKYWENSMATLDGRSERVDTIYEENFQTGDVLIYQNTQDIEGKEESGSYYLMYIEENNKITIDGNEIYGFVGINEDGTLNNISTKYEDLRTLLGKDYYVVLRPSMKLDLVPMNLSVEYSITDETNRDVEVTIKSNEEILNEIDGWKLSEDQSLTKTYSQNTIEEVQIYDYSGNCATANINVSNIDKEAPAITEVNVEKKNCESTVLTVNATDNLSGFGDLSYSFDNGETWQESNQKEYTRSEENIVIKIKDKVGNVVSYVENVDISVGHMEIVDEELKPTCTQTGLTQGKHCSECNEVLIEQIMLDALGHTEVIDERVEPTNTQNGLTQGSHCSICGEKIIEQQIIPALRTLVETWDISATEEDNVIATFYSDGTLIVSGTGRMKVYAGSGKQPWNKCWDNYRIKVKRAIIEGGIKEVGQYMFFNEDQLEELIISEGVESIGSSVIDGSCKLAYVYIPKSIINIASNSFGSKQLLNIEVNEENEKYSDKDGVLFNKDYTELIRYPAGKTEPEYVIPDGVTTICRMAFSECINLNNVIIPDSVRKLEGDSFEDCTGLTELVLPNGITTIENCAFQRCSNLENINIPENLSEISSGIFERTKISKLIIPKNVEEISSSAFNYMYNLEMIEVDKENKKYSSKDGLLFNKDYTELKCYPAGKKEKTYTVPETVCTIGEGAFETSTLEEIIIPNTVTEILDSAFSNCENLIAIQIPDSINVINNLMFTGCTNLKSITIPDTVTKIKSYVFWMCDSLTNIRIPKNVNYLGEEIFDYCEQLNKIEVYCGSYAEEYVTENYNNKLEIIHTEVIEEGIDATCTVEGLTDGKHCLECNKVLAIQEVINPLGHTEIIDKSVAPTCTETGLTQGKHCSVCNEVFVAQEEVKALGHNYSQEWTVDVEATCTNVGSKSHHCTRENCDSKKDVTEIPMVSHNYGEWVVTKAATCTETGSKKRVCNLCQDIQIVEIGAIGHRYSTEWTIDVEPTYTEVGSKSHHCTREYCDSKKDITEIPRISHNYGEWIILNEATCTEPGTKERVCNVCQNKDFGIIEALGHNYSEEWTIDVEATCRVAGSKSHHCTREYCDSKKDITAIPMLSHNYGEWTIVNEATCEETGTKERVCSVCQNKEIETIAELGHVYSQEWTVDVVATCTEAGSKSHHCIRENCNSKSEVTEIPVLSHDFGAWVIDKEPTYEEKGHKYRVCTNCNNEKEEQFIPVLLKEELQVTTTYTVKEKDNQKYVIIPGVSDVQQILSNITSNKELKIIDKAGNVLENAVKVGTGVKVITKQTKQVIYTIVVKGDADGDAKIDFIKDIIRFNNYRLNLIKLDTASIFAGDVNEDGKIDFVKDIIRINNYRLGLINSL